MIIGLVVYKKLIHNVYASQTIKYVALGDSITNAGFAGDNAYVVLYKNYIASDVGVATSLTNLGVTASTSTDLLNAVNTDPNYKNNIGSADLISTMIGFNDFHIARKSYLAGTCGGTDSQDCLRTATLNFKSNFDAIIAKIKTLNTKPTLTLRIADNYYPLIASDYANGSGPILNPYLSQMNTHIKDKAAAYGYLVAEIHKAYNGETGLEDPIAKSYILGDNIHPTNLGFQVIADNFRTLLYSPLSTQDTDNDGVIDIRDNCPSNANADQLDTNGNGQGDVCETDNDADGFSNLVEQTIGTDPNSKCSTTSKTDAYPPDTNRNGKVQGSDILSVVNSYGKNSSMPDWNQFKRYDLNASGSVNGADILIAINSYGISLCP